MKLKPTGSPLADMERVLIAASVTPGCHRRRMRLVEEHKYILHTHNLPTPSAAFRRWIVVSLSIRAPTTVISYMRTLVSQLGGQSALDQNARDMMAGVLTLYGTRAWYDRPPPATPEEISALVADDSHPLWFRVRVDLEYNTISRDADLDYLRPSNVTQRGKGYQIDFEFLKNNTSGAHGVLKMYYPRDRTLVQRYLEQVRSLSLERLFPQDQEMFRNALNRALKRRAGTRSLRRGAAIAAGRAATPEVIQTMLAHRDIGTQRTYTQTLTQHEVLQQEQMARSLMAHGQALVGSPAQLPSLPPPPQQQTKCSSQDGMARMESLPLPLQLHNSWSFQTLSTTLTRAVSRSITSNGSMTLIPPLVLPPPRAQGRLPPPLTHQQLMAQAIQAAMVIAPLEDD